MSDEQRSFENDPYFEWGDDDQYLVYWQGARDEDYSGRPVYYAEITGVVDAETGAVVDLDEHGQRTDWWQQHGDAVTEAADRRVQDYLHTD